MTAICAAYDSPFEWGGSDCCGAACDAFALLTGIDPMAPLRGRYGDRRGARAAIRARGGWRAMCDALARDAGLVACAPGPGALALVLTAAGPALGLCLDARQVAIKIDGGFETTPAQAVLCRRS